VDSDCGGSIKNDGVGWFFLSSAATLVVGFSSTAVALHDTVMCSGSSLFVFLALTTTSPLGIRGASSVTSPFPTYW